MLKSVKKLREKIKLDVNNPWSDLNGDLLALVDKVEREVSERCMELPVDADGVPIRVGDVMETDIGIREVDALQKSSRKWSVGLVPVGGGAFSWHDAETLRHYHKPTIEDVLFEILEKAAPRGFEDGSYVFGLSDDEFAKYADKLREVMAGE